MVRLWLVLVAIIAVVTVFCAVDAIMMDRLRVRGMPKWLWVLLILLVPVVGALLWLLVGRGRKPRTIAPDDDPAFLDELRKRMRDHPTDEQSS